MDSFDFADLLLAWPWEPGRLNVRFIDGETDEKLLQVRLELGILQMPVTGRPDGLCGEKLAEAVETALFGLNSCTPCATMLQATVDCLQDGEVLPSELCLALRNEMALFEYRALMLSELQDTENAIADIAHGIQICNILSTSAALESDRRNGLYARIRQEMLLGRLHAAQAVSAGAQPQAREAIVVALEAIRKTLAALGEENSFAQREEVRVLHGMLEMLVPRLPASQRIELQDRLARAVAEENFKLAAILAAELRQLS